MTQAHDTQYVTPDAENVNPGRADWSNEACDLLRACYSTVGRLVGAHADGGPAELERQVRECPRYLEEKLTAAQRQLTAATVAIRDAIKQSER